MTKRQTNEEDDLGVDYCAVSGIIERVVMSRVSRNYIPDTPAEDLGQEIRMKCFLAADKFDPERIGPNPFNYFATVADNHIYNLRRGTWVPNNPPCLRCEHYISENKSCAINEECCDKIKKYRANMRVRATLRSPAVQPDQDDYSTEFFTGNRYTHDSINAMILDEHIRHRLPEAFVPFYSKMVMGLDVPPNIRKKVRTLVKEILNKDE